MQSLTSSYAITRNLAPPVSSNLTSLAAAKLELSIAQEDTSLDVFLKRAIAQSSAAISRYCNRVFGAALWCDEIHPQRGVRGEGIRSANNPLKLARWPVGSGATCFTGTTNQNSPVVSQISDTSGLSRGLAVFGPGIPERARITTLTPVSFVMSAPACAGATAVALTAGFQVVEQLRGCEFKILEPGRDYEVDAGPSFGGAETTGLVYRLNHLGQATTWGGERIIVTYQAGYALPGDEDCGAAPAMPADLEDACLRLVTARVKLRGRDPTLMQQGQPEIGVQRYWVGPSPGQNGALPPEIQALVDNYRVPVIA